MQAKGKQNSSSEPLKYFLANTNMQALKRKNESIFGKRRVKRLNPKKSRQNVMEIEFNIWLLELFPALRTVFNILENSVYLHQVVTSS